jgi:probable phosphoglycerate mutase
MESTRLIAVRHGETTWNVDGRIQGHLDIGLNDAGRAQARKVAAALAGSEPISHIYSSDLSRALDTARTLADQTGVPLTATAALRERCFGALQGRTFADITTADPEQGERWRKRDPDWTPPGPGGESLRSLRERIAHTVDALAAQHTGQTIALFTHGGVLDVLYRLATGLGHQDARTWQLGNCAINRLLWTPDSGLSLIGWADDAHLEVGPLDERTT